MKKRILINTLEMFEAMKRNVCGNCDHHDFIEPFCTTDHQTNEASCVMGTCSNHKRRTTTTYKNILQRIEVEGEDNE